MFAAEKAEAAGKAFGYSANINDINAALTSYSLTPKVSVPGGFKPVMELVGGTVRTLLACVLFVGGFAKVSRSKGGGE